MSVSSESMLFYNMLKFSWYHIEVKQKKDVFGKRTIANGCNFDFEFLSMTLNYHKHSPLMLTLHMIEFNWSSLIS